MDYSRLSSGYLVTLAVALNLLVNRSLVILVHGILLCSYQAPLSKTAR